MRQSLAVSAGCGLLAASFIAGCQSTNQSFVEWHASGPPQHYNTHEQWWSYQFVYHPYAEVFYEPYTQVYWWQEGSNHWVSGYELPDRLTLDHSTAQVIHTQSDHPWEQHDYAHWVSMRPNRAHPDRANPSAPRSPGF